MEQTNGKEAYRWLAQVCPICEVPPTKLIGRRGGAAHRQSLGIECDVWRCGKCGLIFPNPMPVPVGGMEQHYGQPPDDYFEHHDTEARGAAGEIILRRAEELMGSAGRLLDIGAGRGELLRAARERGWTATGIEPSEPFARHAASYSGAEIRREAVEHCGFDEGSFDVVVMGSVLEHLYNPDVTVREIARILRSGGALYVDVPNEAGLYFRVGNLYQKARGRDWVVNTAPTFTPYHIFGYSPRALRALLAKHGLRPKVWKIYAGQSMVPSRGGPLGALERLAAQAVTAASKMGNLGTYIETWAVKI
ncbi:MAG: methyltransferase domain-containing protein [Pyrinomonadaceae bacterium]